MKITLSSIALLIFFFSFSVKAENVASVQGDCCVCQTGIGPTKWIPFFKLGCSVWLGQQKNCGYKDTHSFGNYDLSQIPKSCDGRTLKLGYVGHWGTSQGTVFYSRKMIKELVQERSMSVEFENTACRGSDDGQLIAKEISDMSLPEGKHFSLQAYQVASVGLWEVLIPGKPNFWSRFDTRTNKMEYPSCKEFLFRGCSSTLAKQLGKSALCQEDENTLRKLTCCEVEIQNRKYRTKGNEEVTEVSNTAKWVDPHYCGMRFQKQ
ncbi:hypothetical protein D3C72_1281550 [compost metagenome]